MKSLILTLIITISFHFNLKAQSPNAVNYQAVARDSIGFPLKNKPIGLRISLINSSAIGNTVYSETHNPITNDFGLFTLMIGNGNVTIGTFSSIDWGGGSKWLKVEVDASGGNNYQLMGTTQLLSVPYALYAEKTGEKINITGSGSTTVTGTHPNYVITSTDNDTKYSAGNGIDISGTTITNSAPDKTVSLTGFGNTTVTGTYPNFTVNTIDNDTSATNEVQSLSLSGNQLSLSKGGGSVNLPSGSSVWNTNSNDIYYNKGNVGIRTSNPAKSFHLNGSMLIYDRDQKLIFGSGLGKMDDSVVHIVRPTGDDGLLFKARAFYFNTSFQTAPIEFSYNTTTQFLFNMQLARLGIGNSNPKSAIHIKSGDVYLEDYTKGIILKNSNGGCYRITVNNSGSLVSTSITCP